MRPKLKLNSCFHEAQNHLSAILDKCSDWCSWFPAPSHMMRIEKNSPVIGSLASRVVLPCHFSMIPHVPSPTTPAPWSGSFHTTPGPGDELRIKWTKLEAQGDKVVLVAQNGVVKVGQEYVGRVAVPSHPLSVWDASLIIARVRTSDAGLYRCEVMHGMEDSRNAISLNVTGEENKHTLTQSQSCTFIGTINSSSLKSVYMFCDWVQMFLGGFFCIY